LTILIFFHYIHQNNNLYRRYTVSSVWCSKLCPF